MAPPAEKPWFADGDAYEGYVGRWSRPIAQHFLNWLSVKPGSYWVDVGCGTGALTQAVLNHADPIRVIGVEPAAGFLRVARESVEDRRVEFRSGSAEALPLEDGVADAVVSGLVLNFVPEKRNALAEMSRIAKNGATIGAYVWDYSEGMQLMRYFWNAARELFADGAERDEGSQFPICRPGPLAELFRSAGLTSVETCALEVPTVFRDFEDFWTPFLRGQGPAGAYCAALGAKDRDRLRERLKSSLPIDRGGGISLVARAWAVRGAV